MVSLLCWGRVVAHASPPTKGSRSLLASTASL
jgi:hypothetical protein